jgi:hypothetical protein
VADDLLRRLRRNTLFACGAIAILALALDPHRPAAAIGVIGGGILVAISYAAVAYTINTFMPKEAKEGVDAGRKRALAALVFAGHYALLAFVAYVMIARLRLHPIGLLGGVTSFVVAVALEATHRH